MELSYCDFRNLFHKLMVMAYYPILKIDRCYRCYFDFPVPLKRIDQNLICTKKNLLKSNEAI